MKMNPVQKLAPFKNVGATRKDYPYMPILFYMVVAIRRVCPFRNKGAQKLSIFYEFDDDFGLIQKV
jgi:hypothetical protein